MSNQWKKEYEHMAGQHGREIRRVVALADAFEDWLVLNDWDRVDAGKVVSDLYAKATQKADTA